eukprot:gnl/MRDRNA2_/MRDRNA2_32217_c0_seq1.p1 gnl/MRDRNA2_/MRDRNA2_32217_c0~~gnl/MRDRNA2_/MRDRNA2_32217_c0_seq1.p1  ORF type:complete len:167 (+),score=33.38 gnl/MRDRNA2_/MRDRNA2_32217_c0_seq1:106-606(+)
MGKVLGCDHPVRAHGFDDFDADNDGVCCSMQPACDEVCVRENFKDIGSIVLLDRLNADDRNSRTGNCTPGENVTLGLGNGEQRMQLMQIGFYGECSRDHISPWSEFKSNSEGQDPGGRESFSTIPGESAAGTQPNDGEIIAFAADGGTLIRDPKTFDTEHMPEIHG